VALGEGAEADGMALGDDLLSLLRHLDVIPCDVFVNGVRGVSARADFHRDGTGGRIGISLNERGIEIIDFEMVEEALPEWVVADAGNEVDGVSECAGVVREVGGRTAGLVTVGQKVPEDFTDGDDAGGKAHGCLVLFLRSAFERGFDF
jgi:hypothetical protein